MIGVITDLIQSTSIIVWAVIMLFLIRQVRRHEMRLDAARIANELREANAKWEESQPVCGCQHHQCFHDETGCGKQDFDSRVVFNSTERYLIPCGCKRYTGPEPLPTVIP